METFNRIAYLLDKIQRVNNTANIMINHGMATRTDAGATFFNSQINDLNSAWRELNKYPWHWIEGVKTVLEIRKRNIKGRVPEL